MLKLTLSRLPKPLSAVTRRWPVLLAFLALLCSPGLPHAENRKLSATISGPIEARLVRVIDGDTIKVDALIWLNQRILTSVRLAGIDAPEGGPRSNCKQERQLAAAATQMLRAELKHRQLFLYNVKRDKYSGRVVATVKTDQGVALSDLLINRGLARLLPKGTSRLSWCPKPSS